MESSPKKPKTEKSASATGVANGTNMTANPAEPIVRPSLLTDPSERTKLSESYEKGTPYPHCVIQDFCNPVLLRKVREEIIGNIEGTYKETDLFKMIQTGDLANMDSLDEASRSKLPALFALRDALYSKEFRSFVSDVTGCGELSDKTDCACNVHPVSGHLLCHDDVIGDRRVSFIIYLTDPDEVWEEKDGGALELYPESPETPNAPDIIPSASVLPTWNTMAMFTVLPGKSFHSIQEVFATDKPRMSIQGWYHAHVGPDENLVSKATLQQLQANPGEEDQGEYNNFTSNDTRQENRNTDAELTEEDIEYLKAWVNPLYLEDSTAAKIRERFEDDGSVQLRNFLNEDRAKKIFEAIVRADESCKLGKGQAPSYTAGMSASWCGVGPAHKQRYLQYKQSGTSDKNNSTESDLAGELLEKCRQELFCSAAFARLLLRFTTVTMLGQRSFVRRFRPGLDYTVAHFGGLTKDPRMDAVLCFVNDSNEDFQSVWDNGEVGGFEAYVLADEDEEKPAEIYRAGADDESGVLNVSASSNSLNLVLRDEGLMRFVKFLSAFAPGSRWDISAVIKPDNDGEDDS